MITYTPKETRDSAKARVKAFNAGFPVPATQERPAPFYLVCAVAALAGIVVGVWLAVL